jgi:hypothetical protein
MTGVLHQAHRGNTEAIATFLNRHLRPQGVCAKVSRQGDRLQVLIESVDIPDQKHFCDVIFKELQYLVIKDIHLLQIYGRRMGDDVCAWAHSFMSREGRLLPIASDIVMTQLFGDGDIVAQAREGDVVAISAYINRILAERHLKAHVNLKDQDLQVIIETSEFLDGPKFCPEFANRLSDIASPKVQNLSLYKQKSTTTTPFLMQTLSLKKQAKAKH